MTTSPFSSTLRPGLLTAATLEDSGGALARCSLAVGLGLSVSNRVGDPILDGPAMALRFVVMAGVLWVLTQSSWRARDLPNYNLIWMTCKPLFQPSGCVVSLYTEGREARYGV